ncbi:hypothetical protein [Salinicola rhizosphaerae]|uniref:Uncharacterized protein n=1 Tax=Salinicola rhizosphaerae TaxID=1443141 RepID=A0ABQ3DQC4_9GAMM|nr:hypothetical protein [Salinicola rhizosphaerae]GHB11851.1 hypothetical protein GCM10009038_06810 [Salinicola rhizosphaerae]
MMSTVPAHDRSVETVPVTIAERHWLDCLDGIADDAHLRDWLAEPRFQGRLIARLRARHQLSPADELPALAEADRRLCRLDTQEAARCARAAGVIVHADAFAQAIQAAQVSALRARFGTELHALALETRDQPRPDVRETPQATDIEALEAAVERDGRRSLIAWYQAQPPAWRAWLALGWPLRLITEHNAADRDAVPENAAPEGAVHEVALHEPKSAPADDAAVAVARLAGEALSARSATGHRPENDHDEESS